MIASVLIVIVSVVLLGYWFRYTCILLLRSNVEQPATDPGVEMEPVSSALERDFRMLTYVWQHGSDLGEQSLEERVLMLDFKIMRLWFRITRTAAPVLARSALAEMAAVVAFLAKKLGRPAGLVPDTVGES